MSKTVKWQGKEVQGTVISFEIQKEDWRVYQLADMTTLRIKNNLTEVVRLNNEHDPNGNPIYVTSGAELIMCTDIPEHLRKPAEKKP